MAIIGRDFSDYPMGTRWQDADQETRDLYIRVALGRLLTYGITDQTDLTIAQEAAVANYVRFVFDREGSGPLEVPPYVVSALQVSKRKTPSPFSLKSIVNVQQQGGQGSGVDQNAVLEILDEQVNAYARTQPGVDEFDKILIQPEDIEPGAIPAAPASWAEEGNNRRIPLAKLPDDLGGESPYISAEDVPAGIQNVFIGIDANSVPDFTPKSDIIGAPALIPPRLNHFGNELTDVSSTTTRVVRKNNFSRSLELTITDRQLGLGTLAGDTEGITYTHTGPTARDITGWGDTESDLRFTLLGIRVAAAPVAHQGLLFINHRGRNTTDSDYDEDNDASPILSVNDNREVRIGFTYQGTQYGADVTAPNGNKVVLDVNDQFIIEAIEHADGFESQLWLPTWYDASTDTWTQLNDVSFTVGRAELSYNTIFVPRPAEGQPVTVDRVKLAKHTGYESHANVVRDLDGDENTPVAWGTRTETSSTETRQEYQEDFGIQGDLYLPSGKKIYVGGVEFKGGGGGGGSAPDVLLDGNITLNANAAGARDSTADLPTTIDDTDLFIFTVKRATLETYEGVASGKKVKAAVVATAGSSLLGNQSLIGFTTGTGSGFDFGKDSTGNILIEQIGSSDANADVFIVVIKGGAAGGGASDFLSLSDTPDEYKDQAGKALIVNDDEDALVFGDAPGGASVSTTAAIVQKLGQTLQADLGSGNNVNGVWRYTNFTISNTLLADDDFLVVQIRVRGGSVFDGKQGAKFTKVISGKLFKDATPLGPNTSETQASDAQTLSFWQDSSGSDSLAKLAKISTGALAVCLKTGNTIVYSYDIDVWKINSSVPAAIAASGGDVESDLDTIPLTQSNRTATLPANYADFPFVAIKLDHAGSGSAIPLFIPTAFLSANATIPTIRASGTSRIAWTRSSRTFTCDTTRTFDYAYLWRYTGGSTSVGGGGGLDTQAVNALITAATESYLNQTQVDSRITTLVEGWGQVGNNAGIPVGKLSAVENFAKTNSNARLPANKLPASPPAGWGVGSGGGGSDVFTWAVSGNTDTIPDTKIPSSIARDTEVATTAQTEASDRVNALVSLWALIGDDSRIPAAKLPETPPAGWGTGGGGGSHTITRNTAAHTFSVSDPSNVPLGVSITGAMDDDWYEMVVTMTQQAYPPVSLDFSRFSGSKFTTAPANPSRGQPLQSTIFATAQYDRTFYYLTKNSSGELLVYSSNPALLRGHTIAIGGIELVRFR